MISIKHTQTAFKSLFALLIVFAVSDGHAQDEPIATPITVTEVLSNNLAPMVPAAGTVFSRNATSRRTASC